LHTDNLRRVIHSTIVSAAMAIGLFMTLGSASANADILDDIGAKYMQGAGGGQISNYVKEALTLRARGFKPSKGDLELLQAGWDYLPNQSRLIEALQSTVAFQRKLKAIQQNSSSQTQLGLG